MLARARAVFRLVRLGVHVLSGVVTVLLVFHRLDEAARARRVMRWSRHMLGIFHIRVSTRGELPRAGGGMLVANHISWLDIHVLHSLLPVRFISKADVQYWPVVGWLAARVGTLFLEREKKSDAMRMNRLMASHLAQGELLTLFPKGTTSNGRDVLPFYATLFQPAIDARVSVWPARLRYLNAAGEFDETPAYYGDIMLGDSLWRIARAPGIQVEVIFMLELPFEEGRARRELARRAHAAVRAPDAG